MLFSLTPPLISKTNKNHAILQLDWQIEFAADEFSLGHGLRDNLIALAFQRRQLVLIRLRSQGIA